MEGGLLSEGADTVATIESRTGVEETFQLLLPPTTSCVSLLANLAQKAASKSAQEERQGGKEACPEQLISGSLKS